MTKDSCAWQTHGSKRKDKTIYHSGKSKTETNFEFVGKKNGKYVRDVKTISWELQHRLVITNLEKRF